MPIIGLIQSKKRKGGDRSVAALNCVREFLPMDLAKQSEHCLRLRVGDIERLGRGL